MHPGELHDEESCMDESTDDDSTLDHPSIAEDGGTGGSIILADNYEHTTDNHQHVVTEGPAELKEADSTSEEDDVRHTKRERHYAALLSNMNEIELDRYEAFRRSCLPRPKMRKLITSLSHLPVHDDKILIVVCSLAKMFVGQLIQESRSSAASMGETGPLRPEHIRRAFKKLEAEGTVMRRRSKNRFFRCFA